MDKTIENRSEILFVYDVVDANPNGDPNDENKPRIDEETGINFVTDVRLKRTIRDYLYEYKKQEVFIRETLNESGTRKTKKERLEEFKNNEELLKKCIDLRLFGATTAVEGKDRMTLTGPVQFKYGRSLHRVDLTYVKGTTVMPSGEGKEQGTFTERYILPYSLIAFYGIVNETAASTQEIPLTSDDIELMLEAIWHGTKNLISGSKFGQNPRLLLQIVYKPGNNYFIGELDRRLSIRAEKADEAIRNVSELKLEVGQLVDAIKAVKDIIEQVRIKIDDRLQLVRDGQPVDLATALRNEKINIQQFAF
ncbi:MAG: type I-B CRISPR-associated protein Cas7/Csh2 [candidate division WOR-3 bacterium]